MTNHGEFELKFGKYKGQTLDQVARTDEGLKYLDWFVGEAKSPALKQTLQGFLKDPELQRRLDTLLED